MFAKLKKKIETDGNASPGKMGRTDSVTSLPRAGSIQNLGPSPPNSVTSEEPSMRDVAGTGDDTARLLQRKTEQCKKLEGNISDLAALIKDKSKTIEKLEATIKQQEDVTNKKLQEQKEEFQKYRDKLVEGFQEDKLKLDKEKNELKSQLSEAEIYRTRYFRKEEENEEFEDLTTQELAKVKHLLINAEQSLTSTRGDLEAKTRQCQAAETQVEKLTDEIAPLRQKLSNFETQNTKLSEEVNERSELVMMLTKEKAAFEKRLDELNIDMTKKTSHISKLEEQLSNQENDHKTLQRNSDLQHNKSIKLLQEKEEHIDSLQERVRTLEQRVSDSKLSGDDRTAAVEAERAKLEEKLTEARLQLSEVKSTWSDKITHLENQISNLNAKIVEDSEELASSHKNAEQMREKFHKQIEDLREKLDEAEKRAFENLEVLTSKDTQYGKQIQTLEHEINTQKLKAMDNDTQLRAKITQLDSELADLEKIRQAEASQSKTQMVAQKEEVNDALEREAKLEAQAKVLEKNITELQLEITKKEDKISSLKEKLRELDTAQMHIAELERKVEELERQKEEYDNHLSTSQSEKVNLMERNADLHKEMQALKTSHADSTKEMQRLVELKSQTIETLQKAEAGLRQRLEVLERQIDQNEIVKVESGLYSERIEEMTATIATLQAQLTEKNRTLKKQEQTLKDLRVTLQRELKVQSLPNDESAEPSNSATSTTTASNIANSGHSSSPGAFTSSSSSLSSQYPPHSPHQPQHNNHQQYPHANMNQSNFVHGNFSHSSFPMGNMAPGQSAAVLTVQSSSAPSAGMFTLTAQSSSVPSGAQDSLTAHTASVKQHLDKDVNFIYLKHVVLKFMLSRESEALQLIKAVSMLLDFTTQEQQLIKDTLEWKMSWFGHRPPVGKGQKAKVIPPTL